MIRVHIIETYDDIKRHVEMTIFHSVKVYDAMYRKCIISKYQIISLDGGITDHFCSLAFFFAYFLRQLCITFCGFLS